ncbi:DUF1552 domain-containing protein [Roseiconus nitratireducens]|uniref:DUF1552 domain-containing protein n=1 Tax=Roseiconus nitratireducens TaxID=2605748 RepID=A0A5M6CYJ0_9BACT|nr:DUF1552 domain-containing protein [Roseiconus nitratireducens]KAA5539062.1 DUF1552 domain-containing protein [Roseiconus nitratireducens]
MSRPLKLSRRTILRGAGVAMGLPMLECMADDQAAETPPSRFGMFYFGTGMNMRQFEPEDEGPDFKLSRILQPLERHRGQFTVLSNVFLNHGGGHDGAYPFATSIARGEKQQISPDQIVAQQHGKATRYPSLQLSVERGTAFGSQALATTSWNEQGIPLAAENDPKVLFDRLFRPDSEQQKVNRAHEFRQRGSVLDLVMEQAGGMQKRMSQVDRQQLDQYFNSVREMERQLDRDVAWSDRPKPDPDLKDPKRFEKSITDKQPDFRYDTYAKLMYDLIALAFQTDSSRVVSYVVRRELSGGVYPEFGVSKGYHSLSHHGNDPRNLEELAKVDTIYMKHWAYFLDRLRSIREGDGTLLDHTVLGFSSGMGIGHSKNRLPTVLSGGERLGVRHRGHVRLSTPTPLSSLWQTMVHCCGVPTGDAFQDSPGVIDDLV